MDDAYICALVSFCKLYKALQYAIEQADFALITEISNQLVSAKEDLFFHKERLGYTPDLSFMEDSSYAGFKIANGQITNEVDAFLQANIWIDNFEKGSYPVVFYDLATFIYWTCDRKNVFAQLKDRRRVMTA